MRKAALILVLLPCLCAATHAGGKLNLEANDDDLWVLIEDGLKLQIKEEWLAAFEKYHEAITDHSDQLISKPPRGLARMLAAFLKLFRDLEASPLDPTKFVIPKDMDRVKANKRIAENHTRFVAWKKVGDARIKAMEKQFAKSLAAIEPTPVQLRQSAEAALVGAVLREQYGLSESLKGIGKLYVRYKAKQVTGLLAGLHEQPTGTLGAHMQMRTMRYVSIDTYVAWLITDLPKDGREKYEAEFRPRARALMRRASPEDPKPMIKLVTVYPGLVETAQALDLLAEWSLAAGRIEEAVEYWRRLQRSFPKGTSHLAPHEVVARLAVGHGLLGEVQAVADLGRDHAEDGTKNVKVGGRTLTLSQHIAMMHTEAVRVAGKDRIVGWGRSGTVPVAGIAKKLWSIRYRDVFERPRAFTVGRQPRFPVDYLPVIDSRGRLFLRGLNQVAIYDVYAHRRHRSPLAMSSAWTGVRQQFRTSTKHKLAEGFYATLAGGRYLTTYPTKKESDPRSTLVCLDAEKFTEGKMRELWRRPRRPMLGVTEDPGLERGLISAIVGARAGRVYAAVTVLASDVSSWLYAFDARNGNLIWKRFLCSRLEDQLTRYPVGAVVCRGGPMVYVSTGQGVFAGVSAVTGRVRWLLRYEETPEALRQPSQFQTQFENRWWLQPPQIVGDRVLFAPPDGPQMVMIEASSGEEVWRYPAGENDKLRYLLGVDRKGHLFMSGRRVDVISEIPFGKGLQKRLVARSDLIYDEGDKHNQLSGWELGGYGTQNSDGGLLYGDMRKVGGRCEVVLYRRFSKVRNDVVARGSIKGTSGVVVLKEANQSGLVGQVRLEYKADAVRSGAFQLRLPLTLYGWPAMTRDDVLVPTSLGILKLDRRKGLIYSGFWRGRTGVLEEYEVGNLLVYRRPGRPPLLVVAGRERLIVYEARAGKENK